MLLHFKICPRCVVLDFLQVHKHFEIKICYLKWYSYQKTYFFSGFQNYVY